MNGISGTQPKHRILAYDQRFELLKVCLRRRIRTDLLKSWKTYPCRRLVHPFRLVGLPFTLRPGRGGQRESFAISAQLRLTGLSFGMKVFKVRGIRDREA